MKAIVLLAVAALVLPAQTATGQRKRKPVSPVGKTAAPAAEKYLVQQIHIAGNRLLTTAQIQAVAALPVGTPVGKADFDAARDRLLATGFFESVAFQFGPMAASAKTIAYEATFEVVEVSSVYRVEFENLPVSTPELEAELKNQNVFYGPKLPGTQVVVAFYARQIEQILAAKNHPARVVGELAPQGKDDFQILFRSAEPLPPIEHVTFTGNQALSSIALQNAINSVAYGVPFSRDHFRQLLETQVRPLYEAKGLLRVAFPVFTTEPAPKVHGVAVHVTVAEGVAYTLQKISLAGVDPDYMDYVKLKPAGTVNFDEVNGAVDAVKTQLKRNGYLDVEAMVVRKMDDTAHSVEVLLQFTPGAQYTMGQLTITGLDLNSEPVVRKLWITEAGKPFNASYPDYFLRRIREDGLFDGLGATKATTQINEQNHVVDVTLAFGASPKPKPRPKPGAMPQGPAIRLLPELP